MKKKLKKILNAQSLKYTAITILSVLLVNTLVYIYVKSENAVYYWDISAYWKNSILLLESFRVSIGTGIVAVLDSLRHDYNLLPLLPLLPFLEVLSSSRTVFVLAILNVYLVPFAVLTALAGISLYNSKYPGKKLLLYTVTLLTALFIPASIAPVVDGRPDSISLVMIALIALLYAKTKLSKYKHYVTLGTLICCMFIFRRYFSFWALGFFLSYIIIKVIESRLCAENFGHNFWMGLKKPAIGLLISGLTIVLIMIVGFPEVFTRYLTEDYSDLYSAYQLGGFGNQIELFIQNFGLILLAPIPISIIVAAKYYRKTSIGAIGLFIAIQSIVVFLGFTRTQTLGTHHYYMFIPLLLWPFFVLYIFLLDKLKKAQLPLIFIPVLIIGILSVVSFTGERSNEKNRTLQTFFGLTKTIAPIVRHDADKLEELASFLQNTMKPSDYIYILSSSHDFNDDIFRNIRLPDFIGINVSGVSHVDKRDGFPNYFFEAQYILAADPPQTHLSHGSQDVIEYPAKLILNGRANNLKILKTFQIDNGVSLHVYKKMGNYSPEFIESIRSHFRNKYPTYPSLNNIRSFER